MFIHGKVRFAPNEWHGSWIRPDPGPDIVRVRIQKEKKLKLYLKGQNPVLRGLAFAARYLRSI
jgi:hypothetical protein